MCRRWPRWSAPLCRRRTLARVGAALLLAALVALLRAAARVDRAPPHNSALWTSLAALQADLARAEAALRAHRAEPHPRRTFRRRVAQQFGALLRAPFKYQLLSVYTPQREPLDSAWHEQHAPRGAQRLRKQRLAYDAVVAREAARVAALKAAETRVAELQQQLAAVEARLGLPASARRADQSAKRRKKKEQEKAQKRADKQAEKEKKKEKKKKKNEKKKAGQNEKTQSAKATAKMAAAAALDANGAQTVRRRSAGGE